jgi:BlaI family penicillinase repressor
MTKTDAYHGLSRRERELMDVIYAKGKATAAEVRAALVKAPSYSAVRTLLRILEEKGYLRHEVERLTYTYSPVHSQVTVSRSALRRILETFYGGSASHAMAALLDVSKIKLSASERDQVLAMIRKAEKEQR